MNFQYDFTEDWFSNNIPVWTKLLSPLKNQEIKVLEIGSYQGRSCVWLCENILLHKDSKIYCIDTFEGVDEYNENQKTHIYERFMHNTSLFRDKVITYKGSSEALLKSPEIMANQFDVIYIDGDHRSFATLQDAVLAYPLLKSEGIMIFDDYKGGNMSSLEYPHIGISNFYDTYCNKFNLLHTGYQFIIQKI